MNWIVERNTLNPAGNPNITDVHTPTYAAPPIGDEFSKFESLTESLLAAGRPSAEGKSRQS